MNTGGAFASAWIPAESDRMRKFRDTSGLLGTTISPSRNGQSKLFFSPAVCTTSAVRLGLGFRQHLWRHGGHTPQKKPRIFRRPAPGKCIQPAPPVYVYNRWLPARAPACPGAILCSCRARPSGIQQNRLLSSLQSSSPTVHDQPFSTLGTPTHPPNPPSPRKMYTAPPPCIQYMPARPCPGQSCVYAEQCRAHQSTTIWYSARPSTPKQQ